MSRFIGRQVEVYAGVESSRGTGVAATHKIPHSLFDVDLKQVKTPAGLSYGGIFEGNQSPVALKYASGRLQTDFLSRTTGVFLKALFGTVSPSGPTDSVYTHTFSLQNDVLHDSLSLYATDVNKTEIFELSMINSMELTVTTDDVVKTVFDFEAKSPQDSVEPSVSYLTEQKFLGRHATLKVAATTADLAAASAIAGVKEFKLNIAKNIIKTFALGTVQPEDINNRKFEVTGSFMLDFQDDTYRDLFENGTYRALRLNLNNTDTLLGATATAQFTIDLSRVTFETWDKDVSPDELASQTISFRALYDITNSNVINNCTLINTEVSY